MDLIPWRNKSRSRTSADAGEHPLATLRDEMERVFDRFWLDPWGARAAGLPSGVGSGFPQLDMSETDENVTIRAEVPGIRPDDVKIEVTGNVLKLSGEKSEQKQEKRGGYRYSERQFGSFSRMVQLPAYVDTNKVDAVYKDGVLSITLPKSPEARPKRITVRNA